MDADLEKTMASKDRPVESAKSAQHDGVNILHPVVVADKLRRSLSPRQVQMIAIGGTIGYVQYLCLLQPDQNEIYTDQRME